MYNIHKSLYYTLGQVIIEGEGVISTMMSRHFKFTLTNTPFFAAKPQQTRGIESIVV